MNLYMKFAVQQNVYTAFGYGIVMTQPTEDHPHYEISLREGGTTYVMVK